MAAGLTVLSQINWYAGAHPGMEFIPDGSRRYHYLGGAEDIVNGLINDDGAVYRRGGGVQTASVDGVSLCALAWIGYLPGRVTMLTIDRTWLNGGLGLAVAYGRAFDASTGGSRLDIFDQTDSLARVGQLVAGPNWLQPVQVTGALFIASGLDTTVRLYGGSPTTAIGSVSMTMTAGSPVATMTTTAGIAAGHMIVNASSGAPVGEVQTVDSGTQITMTADAPASATVTVNFQPTITVDLTTYQPQLLKGTIDAMGSAARRLYVAQRNRIFFSNRTFTLTWTKDDYHELPFGARILGLAGIGDTMLVFSTQGLWAISNTELALTDPAGNVQQSLSQVDPEFTLWDHHGIAAWEGRLIVPGTQDVVMATTGGGLSPITGGVAKLYRGYVKAGYSLGSASVYRGHYLLPVVAADGSTVVDVLVCRLDSGAWTRWSGQSAGMAFAAYTGDVANARSPKLRGLSGTSVLDVSGCFDQVTDAPADADGSQHALELVGRTNTLAATGSHTWRYVRVAYDVTGSGSFGLDTAVGVPGSSFTGAAGAPAAPATDAEKKWTFARQGRAFRPRLTSSGAPSSLVVRATDVGVRPHQQT